MGINRINDGGENRKDVVEKRIRRKIGTQTVYRRHELSGGDSDTTNGTNSEEEEIINNSLRKNRLRRIDKQLVVRPMDRRETPLEWLNYATHYLETFDVTKSEKLVILKRFMTREILDWSNELEKDSPELRYDEFVETLRERLINGEVLCSKKEILKGLK